MSCSMPEIGSCISLISKADIRYEGLLFTVDPDRCTIALAKVQSFGTEDRETQFPIAPQNQRYDYILFRGSDIKDIRVINNCSLPNDPAIMQMHLPPPYGGGKMHPPNYQPQGFMLPQLGGPLAGPPPMGQFGNFGMNNLGGMSANEMLKNSFPDVSQNPSKPNEMYNFLPPTSEPPPQAEHKDQASVLDLIGGGSRSTTPSNILSRKSPTADMAVQTNQSNSRESNNRNGDTGSVGGRDARNRKDSGNHNQNQPRTNQRERRDSGKGENHIQVKDHQYAKNQNQNQNHMQRQGNNQNRGWNNNRNYNNQNNQNNNNMRGRPRGRGPPTQGNRKLKFENDYDFEQANNKFEELRLELSKLKVGEDVKPEQVTETIDKKDDSGNETGAGEHEQEEDDLICYDKTKSFFDTISCEAVERSKGKSQRTDWRQERKLNTETFGVSSTRRGGYFNYSFRGRGGYYNRAPNFRGNYNNVNYRGNYRGRSGIGGGNRNQTSNGLPQRTPHQQQQQQQQQQQPAVIAVAAGK